MLAYDLGHEGSRKALPEVFLRCPWSLALDKINLDRFGDHVAAVPGALVNVAVGFKNNLFNRRVVNQFSTCRCNTLC